MQSHNDNDTISPVQSRGACKSGSINGCKVINFAARESKVRPVCLFVSYGMCENAYCHNIWVGCQIDGKILNNQASHVKCPSEQILGFNTVDFSVL
jgi:hypothetical protein